MTDTTEVEYLQDRLQRSEWKNQALLEKISNMTAQYENQVADLRVEITVLSNKLERAQSVEVPQEEAADDTDASE